MAATARDLFPDDFLNVVDAAVVHFLRTLSWPSGGTWAYSTVIGAASSRAVTLCTDGTVAPLLAGLAQSTCWPALVGPLSHYWTQFLGAAGVRDRAKEALIEMPAAVPREIVRLVYEIAVRHNWWGRSIRLDGTHRILAGTPSYLQTCVLCTGIDNLMSLPEVTDIWQSAPVSGLVLSRTHSDVQLIFRERLSSRVIEELSVPFVAPFHPAQWLRSAIDEYVTEGDMALRAGASFAAVVMYVSAAEAMLPMVAFVSEIPDASPSQLSKNAVQKLFSAGRALKAIEDGALLTSTTLEKLRRVRTLRHGVHPNELTTACGTLSIMDAARAREVVRGLASEVAAKCGLPP